MISVVIPLYNKEHQIAKTLQTVLCQTFQDFEIVIVNDGSTDNSVAEVEKISDSRIRLINQANAGVSAARNRGIQDAKGEYVALLDADDEWSPEYLATQARLAEDYPHCDVFAVNYRFCDAKGKITNTIIRNLPFYTEHGVLSNYFEVASTSHPPLWTSAVMARKKAFLEIGGFPVGIKSGEDLLTWARLACKYKIGYSRKVLASFIFDPHLFNKDQEDRTVSQADEVGKGLMQLFAESNDKGLKKYIALWHKMRTRIYLSKHNRRYALRECLKSIKWENNPKIIAFLLMCFMPYSINKLLFKKLG